MTVLNDDVINPNSATPDSLAHESFAHESLAHDLSTHDPVIFDSAITDVADSAFLDVLRDDVIGHNHAIATPFGQRPLVYADYTASGRAVGRIENAIRDQVLPLYANTHSESSLTGAHTGALREAARATIRKAVNAGEQDCVIFTGSGATSAVNRLVDILGFATNSALENSLPQNLRPVVFIGPYEHHSNELPWRESIADVVRIGLTAKGEIDQQDLATALEAYRDRPTKVGSFSAASNVTGVLSDIAGITRLLKSHGALACWDYAAAGPYVDINVNLPGAPIDAVFVSPHKFVGGPGTPGLLVLKRGLFQRDRPSVVGGGTVAYVSSSVHFWTDDREAREEGGTPAIVESIRAGLVFALKQQVGSSLIAQREHANVLRAWEVLSASSNIQVLGAGADVARLPIFSLRFRHGEGWLPHGYVVALLNDLFGIQARGGCSCAGPYGHDLLGLNDVDPALLLQSLRENSNTDSVKPGWVRVNFHWLASDAEREYLLNALVLIAQYGADLLPVYTLEAKSGVWRHKSAVPVAVPSMEDLLSTSVDRAERAPPLTQPSLTEALASARCILEAAAASTQAA